MIHPATKGIDAILYLNDVPLGGQKNATLTRRISPIKITNKITGEWEDSIAGLRSWSVNCSGMFINGSESYDILESAFEDGTAITVKIKRNNKTYVGRALITSFPIVANYNDTFTYNIILTGVGKLENEDTQSE